jgi:predicted XRE-type DNA-binding protein
MNERPNTEQIKAQLAAEIVRVIGERKLTDAAASAHVSVSEADLERIRRSEFDLISIDCLVGILNALDRHVGVKVSPAANNPLRSIVEQMAAITAKIPPEELEKVPRDLAQNIDTYLYGAPKQD